MAENDKKVLLSLRNVSVKFNVRGRILTAIRNVSLDIYENESIAIVGESGSGKSVLTKTFAGMLDGNGFIPEGSIIYADDELSETKVQLTAYNRRLLRPFHTSANLLQIILCLAAVVVLALRACTACIFPLRFCRKIKIQSRASTKPAHERIQINSRRQRPLRPIRRTAYHIV